MSRPSFLGMIRWQFWHRAIPKARVNSWLPVLDLDQKPRLFYLSFPLDCLVVLLLLVVLLPLVLLEDCLLEVLVDFFPPLARQYPETLIPSLRV